MGAVDFDTTRHNYQMQLGVGNKRMPKLTALSTKLDTEILGTAQVQTKSAL